MTQNIEKIVKDCIAGDINAQKQLYLLFQKKMFGLCLRYSKDYTEAEDIAQNGFLKVFENIKQCRDILNIENWIKKIMINTALMHYRKKKEKLYVVDDLQYLNDDINSDDIISNISAKELLDMIRGLSPKYKTVFNLYAIDGYKHEEISKMLDISIGTSKSNLSRARMILKEKVEQIYKEYDFKIKNVKG